MIFTNNQIVVLVVAPLMVYMMNLCLEWEWFPHGFFCYKNMFIDVSIIVPRIVFAFP